MIIDRERLNQILNSTDRQFSGVVAVRARGSAPVVACRGMAYRPFRVANTDDTRFAIASGVKGFTAAAILSLVDDQRLSLDAEIADLLPGVFPRFSREITVRHLLTHTSGIPDYCDEEEGCDFEALWADCPVYRMRRISDFVPMFADLPMKFRPGERFGYSNSGFLVLGLVIEQLSGMPYTTCVQERVCFAANLSDTGFFDNDALPDRTATGYIENADGTFRSNVFAVPIVGSADGGIITTAEDMLRFWDSLFGGRLVSDAMIDAVLDTRVGPTGLGDLGYSLGFWRDDTVPDDPLFVLIGEDPGASFYSAFSPTTGHAVVVLSNTDYGAWLVNRQLSQLLRSTSNSQ